MYTILHLTTHIRTILYLITPIHTQFTIIRYIQITQLCICNKPTKNIKKEIMYCQMADYRIQIICIASCLVTKYNFIYSDGWLQFIYIFRWLVINLSE